MIVVPPKTRLRLAAALALLLAGSAQALTVGRISVAEEAGHRVLKVQTQGKADPRLEVLDDRLVLSIPAGKRAMKTLKVGSDPVKQLRFGRQGANLRVVADLSRPVKASLADVNAKGFSVDLGPVAGGAKTAAESAKVSVPAPAAEAAQDEALSPAQAGYTYSLVDIALGGDTQHSELTLSANGPASYKPSVREGGRLISLSFRNCSMAYAGDLAKLHDDAIESVSAKQVNVGGETQVKVDVRLAKRLEYALQRDQNQLLLRLDRPVAETKAATRGDLETPVSIEVQNADLVGVLKTLAEQAGFEYQFTKEILSKTPPDSLVTIKVQDRPFREIMDTLLAQVGCKFLRQGNTLYMGSETEIIARRNRLPTITRTYSPKYLTYKQLVDIIGIQYYFDTQAKDRIKGIVQDPRDKQRIMLIGTQDEVSDWLSIIARFDVPASGEAAAGEEGNSGDNKTQIFHLQYLDSSAEGLIKSAIAQLYPEGETAPVPYLDAATRTLVVTTQLKYLRKIEKLLARLDVRPDQVNIEGKIVEVNQSVSSQLGINWTATQTQGNTTQSGTFDAGVTGNIISQLTYATVQNGVNLSGRIQALVDQNQADLVSAPNVTVNDNTGAVISTTDNLVIVSTTQTVTSGVISTQTTNQSFAIPLKLTVKPKISRADRRVNMQIVFTLTTATGSPPTAGAPPPTSEQAATTEVSVNSGDTAVIGGMVRQNNISNVKKVPVLGDIPLLGMLFRYNTDSKDKKEVIIFITPSIVED